MTDRAWPFIKGGNIEVTRAEGVYLYTRQGAKVLDAAGGAIVANIGHGRKRVAEAVYEATLEYSYVVPPWLTPSRAALVKSLDAWLPASLTRVHITSGGSEANEAAMKIALQYQAARGEKNRTKIITRNVSYHGTTVANTAAGGHPKRRRGLEKAIHPYPNTETPYPLRCPLGPYHADTGAYYVEALRTTLEREDPDTVAALLAEPITGSSGGALVPPDDYWPAVRALCDELGIVLIHDEVMTGFGRTGAPFAHQHWDIEPDILVSGKGLAGGYAPIGGVYATEAIGQALEEASYPVMFNTFGAHPAACAAASEVLDIMIEEKLVERAGSLGEKLSRSLHEAFADHPHVAESRGRGLLQAIEIVRDLESLEPFPEEDNVTSRVVAKALEKGVFFYGGGTGAVRDIVCMGPPFIIDEAQINQMVSVLVDAVNEVVA